MSLIDKATKIAEGIHSSVYHLPKENTYNHDVILKVIKEDFNYYPHSSQIFNENELLKGLDIDGIRSSIELIEDDHLPVLILDYFDGVTLKEWLKTIQPSFIDSLRIAIKVSEAITQVHCHNIIHRDISPYNIIINKNSDTCLIDFGLASRVNIKQHVQGITDQLEGTLPYISPEQTGRINHVVDQRSDIYSLGAVFYELFTGRIPFIATDPMELVHAHLALQPEAPHLVNPQIPPVFSGIILKMMAKDVERRYQSASGLLEDLKMCLNQAALKVEIDHFELGGNDQSGKFLIPSKLYGRSENQIQLLESISKIGTKGRKELTMVTGHSGTGKTSLIYEVHKPITEKKGHFIRGKFEQFQKDRPYQAITQAFVSFVSLLLSENKTRLTKWEEKISNAVGNQGKLITDLIPNLELVIGKQKDLPILGINEAQNRFNYVFQQFIGALATSEHPMILFVDDLQWADNASLNLIKSIVTNDKLNYFYIIGAYRDNEADASHPLKLSLGDLKTHGVSIHNIHLKDLSFDQTLHLIQDLFLRTDTSTHDLTNIVYSKTAGNPFFVHEFLKSIHENELVWYDHADSAEGNKSKGAWNWDIKKLQETNFTDNVVEFMIEKLTKIDHATQQVLKLGACIGDSFDLKTINYANAQNNEDLLQDLRRAVIEQLLIVEESARTNQKEAEKGEIQLIYKFAHDRIRQAAYALIPAEEKAQVHQRIGALLLEKINLNQHSERVFDVVYQLNQGVANSDQDYRIKLIRLNQLAGNKARNATAYDTAFNFFEIALSHIEERDWSHEKALLFECHLGAMECAYLLGDYAQMEGYGNLLLSKSETKVDQLRVHQIFVFALIAQSKHLEVINYGLGVLKKVGVKLPNRPNDLHIITELIKTKWLLRNHTASSFKNVTLVDSEELRLIIHIMSSTSTGAYHNYPKLFPLVIFKSMQLAIKNRITINSIPFFGGYASILCGVTGDYTSGYEYGRLSLSLLQKPWDTKAITSMTNVIFAAFINHWKKHQKEALPYLKEANIIALETGDTQYAASALFLETYIAFQCGHTLRDVLKSYDSAFSQLQNLNQEGYLLYTAIVYQGVLNLSKDLSEPHILAGDIFNTEHFLNGRDYPSLTKDRTAYFHITYNKLYLNYLLGNYEDALLAAEEIKGYLDVVMSTSYIPLVHFYDALTRLKIAESSKGILRVKHINQVKKTLSKFKNWSKHSPDNYLHKYYITQAALLSIQKKDLKSVATFELSVAQCRENGFRNELALAYELFADHYKRNADSTNENINIQKAYLAYIKWGAKTKVSLLKDEHPFLIEKTDTTATYSRTQTFGSISGNSILDLSTILKAASTISSEIQLSKAIPTLLNIVMENAGAQTGGFILNTEDEFVLYALEDIESGIQPLSTPVAIADTDKIPHAVIQYVGRTKESVVVASAVEDERFAHDPYITLHQIQSVICLPIIHQSNLLGIIYLENKLAKGTFNLQRVDLLSLLSGQIAITIQNAILYDSLEQKVEERTKEIANQKEKLNEQNQQLTEINKEKDYLINVVSHDLRNPLYLIKGFASMAVEELINHDSRKLVEPILSSCDRLDNLISRILDTSAINAREIKLNYERIDLLGLLRQEMQGYLKHAHNKNIRITLNASKDEVFIVIDQNYLRQIIGNLISNAIKYTYESGAVDIAIAEKPDQIEIRIADTGQGITEEDRKMLFSQFKTLSAKPTSGEKATGLGLSIVKKYVEAMHGKIAVESVLKKGTTFIIHFPVKRA